MFYLNMGLLLLINLYLNDCSINKKTTNLQNQNFKKTMWGLTP